jgi:subtilisin family serine protease
MKLIAPVTTGPAATPGAATITWGVQAVGADTSPFSGEDIIVSVLDTGIDPTHPAFAGVELVRKNFTSASDDDEHGHGTHCAGTIFGRTVNNTRIVGAELSILGTLNGTLLADKLVGQATTTGIAAGFDPGDVGAGIVTAPQS